MESAARLIEAISAILWPLAAIVIIFLLLPVIRAVIAKREFSLEIGGFKLSAQKATEKIQQQISDLQDKIVALEAGGQISEMDEKLFTGGPMRRLLILWVDDHPSNNALEAEALRRDGHSVGRVLDTREALAVLISSSRIWAVLKMGPGTRRPA